MDGAVQWRVGDPAPPPLPRRSEADVVARWQDGPPLVSVLCPTYQHVDFIEDALRGFLGQNTDFPFEVIVRDDASTDGTAEIVRDYAERYPSIVRAILEPVNMYGSINLATAMRPHVRGRFIATCEGDDYWCDAAKIAAQVDVLAHGEGVAVVGHDTMVAEPGGTLLQPTVTPGQTTQIRIPASTLRRDSSLTYRGFHTSSVMYRTNPPIPPSFAPPLRIWGDQLRNRWLGTLGSGIVLSGLAASVYRVHPGGVFSRLDQDERHLLAVATEFWAAKALREVGARDGVRAATTRAAFELLRGLDANPVGALASVTFQVLRGRMSATLLGRMDARIRAALRR